MSLWSTVQHDSGVGLPRALIFAKCCISDWLLGARSAPSRSPSRVSVTKCAVPSIYYMNICRFQGQTIFSLHLTTSSYIR
jgi:hypothetical protein